jgi:hypothetical protein
VLGIVIGVQQAYRRAPELARGAKPAARALEHDRERDQVGRALHEKVGRAGLEKPHRHVGVAGARHQDHRHLEAPRLDRVQQIERGAVRQAIACEQHVHVADGDALERLGDGAGDGQLDVRCVTREVTMRPVLVGEIVFHIEYADGVHGVLSPLVP